MRIIGIYCVCYIAYCWKLCNDDAEVTEMIFKRRFLKQKNKAEIR